MIVISEFSRVHLFSPFLFLMHVVFTLHLVAFYQKIRKKNHISIKKVSLNFNFIWLVLVIP